MSVLWRVFADPIRGVTPLWKVAVLYSIVGGGLLSVIFQMAAPASPTETRTVEFVALVYAAYVTVGVFRCATNGVPAELARLIRIAAVLSLLMLPLLAYLILHDRVRLAT
jgi:hypothetical protein